MRISLILITVLIFSLCSCRKESVELYPTCKDATKSSVFSVKANGKDVFVEKFQTVHIARFMSDEKVSIEVTVSNSIDRYKVSPKRLGIPVKLIADNILEFSTTLNKRQFIVSINNFEHLIIIIDDTEKNSPSLTADDVVDASKYSNIQYAIDEAAKMNKEKSIVYIPNGIYYVDSTIFMRNNVDVYLQSGACILSKSGPSFMFDHVVNSKLYGRGIIDAGGLERYNKYGDHRGEHIIYSRRSKNIEINGPQLRNSMVFCYLSEGDDSLTIRNTKFITPPATEWCDGVAIGTTINAIVENCLLYCNDDCVSIWGGNPQTPNIKGDTRNIIIRNCLGWNCRANGVRIGFHLMENIKDILIEQCDFIGADKNGVLIHPYAQDTKEKDIKNYQSIVVRNCGFEECEKLSCFLFNVQGNINNLCIQNIFADYPSPSVLSGFNSKLNIHHIELSNFHLGEKKTMSLPESLIDLKFVDSFSFNINSPKVNFRPIPGFTIVKNQASAPRIIVERPWRSYIVKIAGEKKSTVRYTINGTNPNETSTLYIEPFNILDEKTIKYRTFKKGSIPSKICQYDLGSIYLPAAKPKNLKSGLLYKYFEGHWNMLPDFKKLTEKKRGTIKVLDISTIMKIRTSDSYGIILEGFIKIPITDEYVFSIMSDDGSRVIVDNNVVVDNDGAHYSEEKSGSIKLAFGYHFFRVDFFNKNGTESFALALSGKASYRLPIQEKMLFH